MPEFPRGWVRSTGIVFFGTTPALTVPATAGVVHVLTDCYSRVWSTAAAGAGTLIAVSAVGVQLAELVLGTSTYSFDENTQGGLELAGAPGAAIVAGWDIAVIANCAGLLTIKGYDI